MPETSCDFDALFDNGYRRLARLLYRITGDASSAEEIASETFLRFHRKPPPAAINIEGWLYRTGFRLALDHLKKERRRARYESLAGAFSLNASPEKPDTLLEFAEERRRLRRALSALKADEIALILLRAEGFTYDELAAKLQLNPRSVGTFLARAEEAFRKEYVKRYGPNRAR